MKNSTIYKRKFDVSVLVLSYHPDFEKEKQTILSILLQKGISFEIIIADDGSEINYEQELKQLFESYEFTDYKLVMNKENQGTIANYISGLNEAEGEYAKAISPGDYLTGETVLKDWVSFARQEGIDWSFSEAIYYQTENNNEQLVTKAAFPIYTKPYFQHNTKKARWNYVVLDDAAHGCTMIGKTELQLKYAKELLKNGCKYGEDYMFRLMMFDGICGSYYPQGTVFYECTTGISSGKNKKWTDILFQEYQIMNRIMMDRSEKDPLQIKIAKLSIRKTSAFAMIFVRGKLRRYLKLKLHPRVFEFDFQGTEEWRKQCR